MTSIKRTLLMIQTWRLYFDEKYRIVTEVYGFAMDSWEARTTPREEAFRRGSSLSPI